MKSKLFAGAAVFIGVGVFACGSDGGGGGGVTPDADGGVADTGTPTNPDGGGTDAKPEPSCAPVTGAPTWTLVDQPIAAWVGDYNKPLDPQITGVAGIAYGNGTWLAVARSAGTAEVTWATSPDAATWTVHTGPIGGGGAKHYTLGIVDFDGTRFIFMGTNDKGTFAYTSTDAQAFSATQVDAQALPLGVIASNGAGGFVAAGSNGYLVSTTDGTTWARRTPTGASPAGYLDIAYGNGKYVLTDEPIGTAALVSSDGVTFDAIPSPIFGGNLSFGDGAFHARGNGKIVKSTDGTTWTDEVPTGTGIGATDQSKLYFLAGRWLIQRFDGLKATSEFGSSPDAINWSEYGKDTVGIPGPTGHGVQPLRMVYGACKYLSYGNYQDADSKLRFYTTVATVSPAP